ncbi:MAG: DNA polymerase III subunit delta [Pseudomonadota bacterium]
MKLSGAKADAFLDKPGDDISGVLIFGQDGVRVGLSKDRVVAALGGPNLEVDMRLTRVPGSELRKDPAALADAVKAVGFFPGKRIVLVEDAGDGHTQIIQDALADWTAEDATIVVLAGALRATSKLRKYFQNGQTTVAIGIYDDPPRPDAILKIFADAGVTDFDGMGREAALALGRQIELGDLVQTAEKLSLYKLSDTTPVKEADIAAVAPAVTDAGIDQLVTAVANGQAADVGPLMTRLAGQGVTPISVMISMSRHFRTLHSAASHPDGAANALSRARPPVFGPRKDTMLQQIRDWGQSRLELALDTIFETERLLRSTHSYPYGPLLQRTLIRVAMLKPKAR